MVCGLRVFFRTLAFFQFVAHFFSVKRLYIYYRVQDGAGDGRLFIDRAHDPRASRFIVAVVKARHRIVKRARLVFDVVNVVLAFFLAVLVDAVLVLHEHAVAGLVF